MFCTTRIQFKMYSAKHIKEMIFNIAIYKKEISTYEYNFEWKSL
jgi:hypothetical protein